MSNAEVSARSSVESFCTAAVERRLRRGTTDLLTDVGSKSDALSSLE